MTITRLADLSPLANHLWQSTLCVLGVWLITVLLRKNGAAVRYWLWFAASVKFLVPFSLLVSAGSRLDGTAPAVVITPPQWSYAVADIGRPFTVSSPVTHPIASPASIPLPALLLAVWLCGFAVSLVLWFRWWRQIRATRKEASLLASDLPIPVMSSTARIEPGVVGVWKPVLLLPEGIAEKLAPKQLHAVLAHEMCHVRRQDNLTAAIHMLVETVFWFYPLLWWISVRLVEEREQACDEAVLQLGNDAETYAEGILNVCKFYVESPLACVSGISGADLKGRVVRIMTQRLAERLSLGRKVLLIVAGIAALAAPLLYGVMYAPQVSAQSSPVATEGPTQSFEVASIKLFHPGLEPENRRINISYDRLTMRQQTLRDCIAWAYEIQPVDIKGPASLDSEEYDIDARAPESSMGQFRPMLRNLLIERFKLASHQLTEQHSTYALIVGKGGPKLREAHQKPSMGGTFSLDGDLFTRHFVTNMTQLADLLPMFLDRPVVDKTGLTGVYDFTLKVEMGMDAETRLPKPGQMFYGFGMTGGIFPAVEQLGLKLESQKGPVKILVIDHVEKPSDN
jgi:bla regulator protein BlaR1